MIFLEGFEARAGSRNEAFFVKKLLEEHNQKFYETCAITKPIRI